VDAGAAFVARSIESQLGTRPDHVRQVDSGNNEDVYEAVLGERVVVFKADQEANYGRVVLEAWANQRARELGAPVPRVLATDLARETYPRHYIILEKLPGVPLADIRLPQQDRLRLVEEAGRAVRAIHEIGIPGFGSLEESSYLRNAEVRGEYDVWSDFVDHVLDVTLPVLRAAGAIDDADVDRLDQVVVDHVRYQDLGPVGHLLHGGFDAAHVLVDQGEIAGIVDFDDRCSGDPAWDLGGFLIDHAADTRHLLTGYDADKDRAEAFEVTIPLCGGLRALLAARRAHDREHYDERERLLVVADTAFRALGHPGARL
jgi:aminoglycoside phosphotransferase (APT) family kinase protein